MATFRELYDAYVHAQRDAGRKQAASIIAKAEADRAYQRELGAKRRLTRIVEQQQKAGRLEPLESFRFLLEGDPPHMVKISSWEIAAEPLASLDDPAPEAVPEPTPHQP